MNWLRHWLPGAASDIAVNEQRWVVLDVETSGMNTQRDALLAIAAIALRVDWPAKRLQIDLGDSFEVVLAQSHSSSKDNILLHGIGTQRQKDGVPAPVALREFAAYCGQSPLLAFHAAFDRSLLARDGQLHQVHLASPWVDVEQLCAVTHSDAPARSLDEWMAYFGVHCAQRHQAAADTLATCELLLRIWPQIARQCDNWLSVQALAQRHRWVQRR